MTSQRFLRASCLATASVALTLGLLSCRGTPIQASPAAAKGPTPADARTSTAGRATAATPGATGRPTGPTTAPTVAPPTTVQPSRATTTVAPPPATTVAPADSAQVLQIQQRLTALGYWLATPDGKFGSTTQQAVYALQKAAGLPRTGVVDAATTAALNAGTKPTPSSSSGHVIEVDLAHQLVLIVTNGHLDGVLNTSTGGGYTYYDHGARQVATTPTGHFTTNWEVNGSRVSSLGVLWRPKYFVGGIAIHGDSSVPAHPVSHGCVRVSNQAIDWIWATGSDPIGTPVWVY